MEHIWGHVVRALGVDGMTIHNELNATVSRIQLYCSNTIDLADAVNLLSIAIDQSNCKVVDIRMADIMRPPVLRLFYCYVVVVHLLGNIKRLVRHAVDIDGNPLVELFLLGVQYHSNIENRLLLGNHFIADPYVI